MVDATIIGSDFIVDQPTGRNIKKVKCLVIETDATVDATNSLDIDLAEYGGTTLLGVVGCAHSTDNSVIVAENATSAAVGTVITLTLPAGTDDDKRVQKIFFT